MLSTDLIAQIRELLVELDGSDALFSGLAKLAEVESHFVGHLDSIIKGGQELNSGAAGLHSHVVNARQVLPHIPSRNLYRAIERTTSALRSFHDLRPANRLTSMALVKRLEQFTTLFETYLAQQTGTSALPVLRAAPLVLEQLQLTRSTLDEVLSDLELEQALSDDEEVFAIYFSGNHDLNDLAEKLRAIADILETVASFGSSNTNLPSHRVLRVESGSLLVKLAIARWMGGIIRPWISALANYFYRTRTIEGALTASSTDAKAAIKQTLDVRQLLNKAGIETPDMDKRLEEAATRMAENVSILVRNQIRMKLGDENFEVQRPNSMISYNKPKQLPPPSDSTGQD